MVGVRPRVSERRDTLSDEYHMSIHIRVRVVLVIIRRAGCGMRCGLHGSSLIDPCTGSSSVRADATSVSAQVGLTYVPPRATQLTMRQCISECSDV